MSTNLAATPPGADSFRRPSRSARAAGDALSGHGGRLLAAGTVVVAAVALVAHFIRAVVLAPFFPTGSSPWPAWIALGALVIIALVLVRIGGGRITDWMLAVLAIGVAVPIALDLTASAGLLYLGVTPTAAAAASLVLLPVGAVRETRIPLAIAAATAILIAGSALAQASVAGSQTVIGLAVAASAVLPAVFATIAIDGFRRLVGRELDLSLVQSTVTTPRSAVGMRASEELAQLDFDAESLLDDVGSGRLAIPLPPETAARAGSLAARLRVRLIEGRTDTWLRHAVTESEFLSARVIVIDPTGCAGLLAPRQREGLLLAIWLLVSRAAKGQSDPLTVRLRGVDELDDDDEDLPQLAVGVDFTVAIDVSGLTRRRVDPATWDAVDSVGTYRVVSGPSGLRIDIDCRIDASVRRGGAAPMGAVRPRGA